MYRRQREPSDDFLVGRCGSSMISITWVAAEELKSYYNGNIYIYIYIYVYSK